MLGELATPLLITRSSDEPLLVLDDGVEEVNASDRTVKGRAVVALLAASRKDDDVSAREGLAAASAAEDGTAGTELDLLELDLSEV